MDGSLHPGQTGFNQQPHIYQLFLLTNHSTLLYSVHAWVREWGGGGEGRGRGWGGGEEEMDVNLHPGQTGFNKQPDISQLSHSLHALTQQKM